MKLRFSQVKLFTGADLTVLEAEVNAWLVATGGELVSITLTDTADFVIMVVYTTE